LKRLAVFVPNADRIGDPLSHKTSFTSCNRPHNCGRRDRFFFQKGWIVPYCAVHGVAAHVPKIFRTGVCEIPEAIIVEFERGQNRLLQFAVGRWFSVSPGPDFLSQTRRALAPASAGAISAARTPIEPTKINRVIRIRGSPFETFRFQKKRFWRFLVNGFSA
jgi:hypothetical protein